MCYSEYTLKKQYKIIVQERVKLKMSIRYVINEEKRTCVAILENTKYDAISKINKMCKSEARFSDEAEIHVYSYKNSKYKIPNRFVGVAKCSPEDVWDVEVGKRIAREKLLDKYHKALHNKQAKFLDNMLYVADRFAEELKLE